MASTTANTFAQQQEKTNLTNLFSSTLLLIAIALCGSRITYCRPAGSRRRGLRTPADDECHQLFNVGYTLAKIGALDPRFHGFDGKTWNSNILIVMN